MFKLILLLVISIAACHGDSKETTPKPVYCGETPDNILTCLKAPHILSPSVISKCRTSDSTECDSLTCAFREYNWLKDGNLDKPKVVAHFNQLAKDKPEWKTVIDQVVSNCLERRVPPLGVFLNCPAYDIMHCALIYFVQKAPESQWEQSPGCVYPRQYAGACAVCPSSCFAPQVPYGSCNACYAPPQ